MLSVASGKQFWNSQKLCMDESAFIITVSGWRHCYKTACPHSHSHSPFYFSSTLQSQSSPLSVFSPRLSLQLCVDYSSHVKKLGFLLLCFLRRAAGVKDVRNSGHNGTNETA